MTSKKPAIAIFGLAIVLPACGMAGSGGGATDGGAGGGDAGIDSCSMSIEARPSELVVGDMIELDGDIAKRGAVSGLEAYDFEVTLNGFAVALTERDPFDGSKWSFIADQPGPYRVELRGSVGATSCFDGLAELNVLDPGAGRTRYRFRFVPAAGQLAPTQVKAFWIPNGANFALGTVGLDTGLTVSGVVRDGVGVPVAAYVRFTRVNDGAIHEAFAGPDGAYTARLGDGDYDVLVVPRATTIAPERVARATSVGLLGDLTLSAGELISGTVLDASGQPIIGASVSMRSGGVPSAIAVTDNAGAFSLLAVIDGATSMSVTPAPGGGIPRLSLPASAGLVPASGRPLSLRYAAGITSRNISFVVTEPTGTPAGASVTLVTIGPGVTAAGDAAGTATALGGNAMDMVGSERITVTANASGEVGPIVLPDANYQAIMRSDVSALPSFTNVSLLAGDTPPATISMVQPATIAGRVSAGGSGLAGIRITALPRGLLGSEAGAAATVISDESGRFAIAVVANAAYELDVVSELATWTGTLVPAVVAPGPGGRLDLPPIVLAPALTITGRVQIPGVNSAAGVAVEVFCDQCNGTVGELPLATAVTNIEGRFAVAVPDLENNDAPMEQRQDNAGTRRGP